MAGIFCVNKNSKEYKDTVVHFGDSQAASDYTQYLFHKNNGNPLNHSPFGEPSVLYSELLREANGDVHQAMVAKAYAYNREFIDKFGIDWTKSKLTKEDWGVYETGEPTKEALLGVMKATRTNRIGFAELAGRVYPIYTEDNNILTAVMESADNAADVISVLFSYPFTKGLIDNPVYYNMLSLITDRKAQLGKVKVVINTEDTSNKHYMSYLNNTITIYKSTVDAHPSMEAFFVGFMHEVSHALTTEALRRPTTESDRNFKETVETLYRTVKNSDQAYILNQYGLKNAEEFIALFITDNEFNAKLKQIHFKSDKSTLWDRIIFALATWWMSIVSTKIIDRHGSDLHKHLEKTITNFFEYNASHWDSREYQYTRNEQAAFADLTTSLEAIKASVDQSNPNTVVAALAAIKALVITPDDVLHDILEKDPTAYKPEVPHEYKIKGEPAEVAIKNPWTSVTEARDNAIKAGTKAERERSMTPEMKARLERGGAIGSLVHQIISNTINSTAVDVSRMTGVLFNDSVPASLGYVESLDETTQEIKYSGIIGDLVKLADPKGVGGNKILSEVVILDSAKRIIGTIDMVVITRDGKIHLYDFKTKAGATGFKYYKNSDQLLNRTQLLMYSHMLGKTLGVKVEAVHIVMLNPVVRDAGLAEADSLNDQVLVEAELAKGNDTVPYIESIGLAISTAPVDKDIRDGIDTPMVDIGERDLTSKILGSNLLTGRVSQYTSESDIDAMLERLKQKEADPNSKLRDLRLKLIAALEERYEVIRRKHSETDIHRFSEFLDALVGENSIPTSFSKIVTHAIDETDLVYKEMKAIDAGEKELTPYILRGWRDYFSAYNVLDQLSYEVAQDPTLIDGELYKQLDNLILFKNKLKTIYEERGRTLVAKEIYHYYNGVHTERREQYGKQYRLVAHHLKKGVPPNDIVTLVNKSQSLPTSIDDVELIKGNDEANYVEIKLSHDAADLDKLSYEIIYDELNVASTGISDFSRLLDAAVDSSDPVASSVIKMWLEKHQEHMREAREKLTEFYQTTKEFEDWVKDNMPEAKRGGFKSEKEIWKLFLEHDENGETTKHIVSPFLSKLEQSRMQMNIEANRKTVEGAKKHRGAWYKDNFVVDDLAAQADYNQAFYEFLKEAAANGEITSTVASQLYDNLISTHSAKWSSLADTIYEEDGETILDPAIITKDFVDKIYKWENKNKGLYIVPKEKWHNKEWDKLIAIALGKDAIALPFYKQFDALEKSSHPVAKMYTLFSKSASETDSKIPYGFYVKNQLPGVSKSTDERVRGSNNPLKVLAGELAQTFLVKADDELRNPSVASDSSGKKVNLLPVYHTASLPEADQSYDLPSVYYKYWVMGNNYAKTREVISIMELAKEFIDNRKTLSKAADGTQLYARNRSKLNMIERAQAEHNENIAKQFDAWFNIYVLNNKTEVKIWRIGNLQFDLQKFVTALNKFTSLNLLGLNMVQGIANITVGEVMTQIEAVSREFFTPQQLALASLQYSKLLPGILGDVGARRPSSVGSLLFEEFDVLNEGVYGDAKLSNSTRLKAMFKSETLQVINMSGEHEMRGRAFLALLTQVTAYDKSGKELGLMLDQYSAVNGRLVINPEVNLVKSKWTTKEQNALFSKFHGIMYRTHGAYGRLESVAIQLSALGQLAYLFRKFVWPGIKRRYGKKQYIARLDQTVEGNYVSTYKFFSNLQKDMRGFSLALMTEHWAGLSAHEKGNINRTIAEVATLIMVLTLASVAYTKWGDTDDDEPGEARFWAMIAYQAYRLKAELLFYSPKLDEAMSLLRSPMASMSQMENVINLISQIFNPTEVYERGPWKGHLKIKKDLIQFIPVYKQFYKLRDIEEQIVWYK